ncbi:hypothetical protein GGR56DRAFT_503704 [Xylariaceae sp. FL0804]|nr:hypothetical protein GGR56DRAFT_503704 [Xylariaceae sp. FL0804]
MDSARKIELQAPEDLAYLLANVRRAAAARVDEAFPPIANDDNDDRNHKGGRGEDELRTRIEELVDEYITRTFTLASANLSINGLPADPAHFDLPASGDLNLAHQEQQQQQEEEAYEPFDARKRARVEELTRDEEDLLRDIAALKRGVPAAAAAAWQAAWQAGVRADDDALAAANSSSSGGGNSNGAAIASSSGAGAGAGDAGPAAAGAAAAGTDGGSSSGGKNNSLPPPRSLLLSLSLGANGDGDAEGENENDVGLGPLPRQADVERAHAAALRGLARLKRELPAVVARMERARGAGEYVVTEP